MNRDLSLLTDLYELTMMQGYYKAKNNKRAIFDVFFRQNPFNGGYAIAAGLEQIIDYINNLHFSDESLSYLKSLNIFDSDFLDFLSDFHFSGDIYSVPEGSVIFPGEPVIKIKSNLFEAQLMESAILNIFNHQSLIATKASRICYSAGKGKVMEFGLRRAQGPDAAVYGARAAVIAGCLGTSNVLASKEFDLNPLGTHAHAWIMSFESEYEAFKTYAKLYPDNCTLLVDTYDTLKSGLPNAIKVFKEIKEAGKPLNSYGIRLDSGDLAYLTKQARQMLDEAGLKDASISASGDLDEFLISSLISQGACIDSWGVGTKLITAHDDPSFGGVYKLAAIEDTNGNMQPKLKISDNAQKITNPGDKIIYRIYDSNNIVFADLITLSHEKIDVSKPLRLFDPVQTWKQTLLEPGSYTIKELLIPIFKDGVCLYKSPSVKKISEFRQEQMDTIWDECKRLYNPHQVHIDLSNELYDLKKSMLNAHRKTH